MNKTIFLSIGLLIAFFLPWIDLNIITISGYEIPTSLDKLSNLSNLFTNGNDSNSNKFSYILYLIPLLSIVNLIKEISKNERPYIFNEFLIGLITNIYLFFVAKGYKKDFTSLFSLGFYLTSVFSILGYYFCIIQRKKHLDYVKVENSEKSKNISSSDKNDLLKQLEQLHSLKEKKILTEYIYEQEKNEILDKIKNKKDLTERNVNLEDEESSYNPIYEQFQNNKALILSFVGVLILIYGGYSYLKSKEPYQQKMIGIWILPDDNLIEFKQDSILILLDKEGKNASSLNNGKYSFVEKDNELILDLPSGSGQNKLDTYHFEIIKFDKNKITLRNNNMKEVILTKK